MRTTLTLALTLAAAASGCNRSPPEPAVTWPAETPRPAGEAANAAGSARPPSTAPVVEIPSGAAPTTLQKQDLIVGTGAEATSGRRVRVQYTGVAWSTRRKFDSSWDRGADPFAFQLGGGQVIRGWDQGVVGMRVGGRRRLTIPPDLGYGERGAGSDIGPNETLVFVVDLVAVE